MSGTARWRNYPDLPEQAEARPEARLTYETVRDGKRHHLSIDGRDARDIDSRIVQAIGNIRAGGHVMVKTEMTVHDEEWVYEYNRTGEIVRVFRNGEVTP